MYAPDDFAPEHEVRSELPPFAVSPHWVTMSVSGNAVKLYNLYAAHGSGDSLSDRVVYPTLDDLAAMMGLSRGDKVTPYMRELEKAGAIEVEKVRSKDGLRWRYRITVKVTPPQDYDGPLSMAGWYDRYRPEYAEKNAKSSVSAGQPQHPENRVLQDPENGGLQHPPEGVRRRTNLKNNKPKKTQAPSARSAADARRATTGSSAHARNSGCAAPAGATAPPKSRRLSKDQATQLRAIEAEFPQELRELLPKYRPEVIRDTMLAALAANTPRSRTGVQVGARVARRWYAWGFSAKADSASGGEGLKSVVGALVAMLKETDCSHPRCEDGTVIDTDEPCQDCARRTTDRRAAHRAGNVVPAQRFGGTPTPMWECSQCGAPGSGAPPEQGVCKACRAEAAAAEEAVAALQIRWNREHEAAERAGWLNLLEEAYAERRQRECEQAECEQAEADEAACAQAASELAYAQETARLRAQVAAQNPELVPYAQLCPDRDEHTPSPTPPMVVDAR